MGFRPTPPTSKNLQSQKRRKRSPVEDMAILTEEALVLDDYGDLDTGEYGMMGLVMTVGIRNADL